MSEHKASPSALYWSTGIHSRRGRRGVVALRTAIEDWLLDGKPLDSDLEKAMRLHWEVCGIGPWDVYEFDASKVDDFVYRGRPATHKALLALAWKGDMQLELLQPVSGYCIYDEHLERKGEGLHHIKLYHADCAAAVADYARRGYPVTQSGRFDLSDADTTPAIDRSLKFESNSVLRGEPARSR